MATRNGQSYFWALIEDFLDDDILNRENFYKGAIHRLHDGIVAGRDLVFNLTQQLGSTNAGTSAVQRGSVVMGTLAFYDPIDTPVGSVDGKTIILETDPAGPVTITFTQPTSPAHLATEINTQGASLGIVATVDTGVDPNTGAVVAANVGKLLLVRPSGATASLTVKGAGTANAILGLPLVDTTASGAGTVNDGASRIGLGAFGSWLGGTLQAYLAGLDTAVSGTLIADGGTLASGNYTILTAQITARHTVFKIPNVLGSYEYTLPAVEEGKSVSFRMNPNPPNTPLIKRPGGTTIATMTGELGASPVQQYVTVTALSGAWVVTSFGLSEDNYTLV
jgi:hypothetical protein